jgi:glutamate/tyrosine decarboxylase-like PLP-dependent enzyme
MSTKKILLIIGGVIVVLGLIVALFVGGIAWFALHAIGSSEAAETARAYLRNNEVLKQDIGEVKDFGSIVTGNINAQNGDGVATLYLKVIGEKRNVNARVDLSYRNNRSWRVTGASYERDEQTIDLMQGYGPPSSPTPPSN